jgi:hypothetical protein
VRVADVDVTYTGGETIMTNTLHLTKDEALALTERIRACLDEVDALIIEAWEGQAHLALGYSSWVAYAEAEFPKYIRTRAHRLEAVIDMTDAGMSTRSIGAALGVDQKTVVNDQKKASDAQESEENSSPAGEKPKPTPKPRTKAKRPVTGGTLKRRVEQYQAVVAEHPSWGVKHIEEYLAISHQEVGRLRLWAYAPAEIMAPVYAGQLSAAVAETILAGKSAKYLDDADKIALVHKFLDGVIITTAAPKVREIMDTLPKVKGKLREQWMDRDGKMTFEQLRVKMIDIRADADEANKAFREQEKQQLSTLDVALYSDKTQKWLTRLDGELTVLQEQVVAVIASAKLTGTAPSLSRHLRQLGNRFWDLADYIEKETAPVAPVVAIR